MKSNSTLGFEEPILVSIIVPLFNSEKTLGRCITSILDQDYKNIELILIDDGSKDQTCKMCQKFTSDSRVHYYRQNNKGVSAARNLGIELSNGKLIMFCDSDDWVDPNWCSAFIKNYRENNLLICGYLKHINTEPKNQTIMIDQSSWPRIGSLENLHMIIGSPWNKIYSSKIIKKNRLRFNECLSCGEDLIFNLDYLRCITGNIHIINMIGYHYSASTPNSLAKSVTGDFFNQCKKFVKHIEKHTEILCLTNADKKDEVTRDLNYLYNRAFFEFDKLIFHTMTIKKPFFLKVKLIKEIQNSKEFVSCYSNVKPLLKPIQRIVFGKRGALINLLLWKLRK